VSIIRAGKAVQSGTLTELRHLTRSTVIAETTRNATALSTMPGIANVDRTDGRIRFDVDSDHLEPAIAYLTTLGLRGLTCHPPTLEELFLRHYGDRVEP
jgi:ABC-2 type transport system ATP-binding protein